MLLRHKQTKKGGGVFVLKGKELQLKIIVNILYKLCFLMASQSKNLVA